MFDTLKYLEPIIESLKLQHVKDGKQLDPLFFDKDGKLIKPKHSEIII